MRHWFFHVLPGCCVLCLQRSQRSQDLCVGCEKDLPWVSYPCLYCGLSLNADQLICEACRQRPPDYSAIITSLEYRFPVDALVQRFKNSRHLASGRVLTDLLLLKNKDTIGALIDDNTLVVPVPIHWRRLRTRGFNQAEYIATVIARSFGLKVSTKVLRLTRRTPIQKRQGRQLRQDNLIDAFSCHQQLYGRRVLLIDDVVTTTATVSEATKTLVGAGADDVVVLALARTPRKSEL